MQKPPSAPHAGSTDQEEGEISLLELVLQLAARKWWLVTATLIGLAAGAFWGQLPPNQYQSRSVVQIEQRSGPQLPSELVGNLLGAESPSPLATQIHIIRSRLILAPVVENLSLNVRTTAHKAPIIGEVLARRNLPVIGRFIPEAYARAGEAIRVVLVDAPNGLPAQPVGMTVQDDLSIVMAFADGSEISASAHIPVELPDGTVIEIVEHTAPPGRQYTLSFSAVHNGVGRLSAGLDIRERGVSGIVDFRYSSRDPRESVQIINAVVASYQDHSLRRRSAEIDQSIDFIDTQLPEIRADLEAASTALAAYRRSDEGRELSISTQELLSQIVSLETEIENVAFRREQLLQRLTPNHPDSIAVQAEENRLESRLSNLREQLGSVPEAEQELARLTTRVERARQLEIQLVNRVEQLRILRASTVGNIFVLEPAENGFYVGPNRRNPIVIGGLIGFVLSALVVFGINLMRRGIEDGREIEKLGLSLMATLNKVPDLVGVRSDNLRYGIVATDPESVSAEAFRGMRTGMRFSMAASNSKTLMITSCAPGDGKSFIALNLALVSVQAGSRVLLIDSDMRRGGLRKFFRLGRNAKGLSDILSGASTIEDVIYLQEETGLHFMPTGVYPPNPSELLSSSTFKQLLSYLDDKYDLIVIDAPPVLAVTDPSIIGQYVGMSLLVIRHLHTTISDIQFAKKNLDNAGVRISGCIINQFDARSSRYGAYGQRYGYSYGSYNYKYQ